MSRAANTFLFLFSNKKVAFTARALKMLVRKQSRKTLIRLLLQKQSDLGLSRLSFWKATSFRNLRIFNILKNLQIHVSPL